MCPYLHDRTWDTVYAADKNVTSFDVSWELITVPWKLGCLDAYITT
jgi:hypothetical protein